MIRSMHDPYILLWRLPKILEIWHKEPKNHDSGKVCRNHKRKRFHIHHWSLKFLPYTKFKRLLFSKCEDCGGRFTGKQKVGTGFMSSDKRWHDRCFQLMQLKNQRIINNETMHRLFTVYEIDSMDKLQSLVTDSSDPRDQFIIYYDAWNRIENYRSIDADNRWKAPNQHFQVNQGVWPVETRFFKPVLEDHS